MNGINARIQRSDQSTKLGKELGVDYSEYDEMVKLLKEAESYTDYHYRVAIKWSKMLSNGKRHSKCFGFHLYCRC